jgi:hypothetical protein
VREREKRNIFSPVCSYDIHIIIYLSVKTFNLPDDAISSKSFGLAVGDRSLVTPGDEFVVAIGE